MNVLLGSESIESATAGQVRRIISQRTVTVKDDFDPRMRDDIIKVLSKAALASGKWVISIRNGITSPDYLMSTDGTKAQRSLTEEANAEMLRRSEQVRTYVDATVIMNDGTEHRVRMTPSEVEEFNKTKTIPPAADLTQNLIDATKSQKAFDDPRQIAAGFKPIIFNPKIERSDAEIIEEEKKKKMLTGLAIAAVAFLVLKGH